MYTSCTWVLGLCGCQLCTWNFYLTLVRIYGSIAVVQLQLSNMHKYLSERNSRKFLIRISNIIDIKIILTKQMTIKLLY